MHHDLRKSVLEPDSSQYFGNRLMEDQIRLTVLRRHVSVDNDQVFDLILNVTQTLQKYKLEVKKIYISENLEITVYKKNVKVYFGTDKDLSEKIATLSDMQKELEEYSGTLDMSKLDREGVGYHIKTDQ